mmetsp:Transcript_8632/g.24844  ORF Transcript_8632/g.24844 Transcript_8632/m.24844 type:complete len:226 (-) Transcript_8632:947-1624(-)
MLTARILTAPSIQSHPTEILLSVVIIAEISIVIFIVAVAVFPIVVKLRPISVRFHGIVFPPSPFKHRQHIRQKWRIINGKPDHIRAGFFASALQLFTLACNAVNAVLAQNIVQNFVLYSFFVIQNAFVEFKISGSKRVFSLERNAAPERRWHLFIMLTVIVIVNVISIFIFIFNSISISLTIFIFIFISILVIIVSSIFFIAGFILRVLCVENQIPVCQRTFPPR